MSGNRTSPDDLAARYRGYFHCLNAQAEFLADDVIRNDARLGHVEAIAAQV